MSPDNLETSVPQAQLQFTGAYAAGLGATKGAARFRRSRIIPALFVFVACMVPAVPDVWTRQRQIGPLGVDGSMWSAIAALSVASVSLQLRQSWVTVVSFLGLCAMILLGVVESQVRDVDLIVGDIFIFAAVPIGAAWAFTSTRSERRLFLRVLYCANWVMLAGTDFLLMHGTLHRSQPGPRLFVYSEFYCTWALAALTPFVYFDKNLWLGKKKIIAQIALASMALLMAWTAYISITRSVLLQLALCLVLTAAGLVKFRKLSVRYLLAGLATATGVIGLLVTLQPNKSMNIQPRNSQRSLEQRFLSTDLASEERFAELHELFEQYGEDLFVGRGLGSGFDSMTIGKQGENYAYAPHISIVTLLMKGGVLAFVLGIVLPAVLALKNIVGTTQEEVYGSGAGILLFIAFSCISGGWSFPQLFGYGFLLSLMLTLNESRGQAPRHVAAASERLLSGYSARCSEEAI